MNTNQTETRDERNARLEAGFRVWCQAVAKHLGATLEAPRNEENPGSQSIRLVDGRISLNLNRYEGKIHVSGNWPQDHTGQTVTPRDTRLPYGTKSASINVGLERDPKAAANDIARRFVPDFAAQYAACVECVQGRAQRANSTEANAHKIAAAIGAGIDKNHDTRRSEANLSTSLLAGIHTVTVDNDSASFHVRSLPVDQAIQVLQLLKSFKV